MKYLGHKVEAKPKQKGSRLLYAYIDGRLAKDIEPSTYRGVIFRRVKRLRQDDFRQEINNEHDN